MTTFLRAISGDAPTWMAWAIWTLEIARVVLAVVASRIPFWGYHRPVARLFLLAAISDIGRALLGALALVPARAALGVGPPFSGAVRVVFHVTQALLTAYPIGLLAAIAVVLLGAGLHVLHLAGAWTLLVVAMAMGYPTLRGVHLQHVYLGLQVATQIGSWIVVVVWALRRRREPLMLTEMLLLLLLVVDAVVTAGPYAGKLFTIWPSVWSLYLVEGIFCVVLQAIWIRNRPRTTS